MCYCHCRWIRIKKELKGSHGDYGPRPFSINTDAFNKENQKFFSVAITYFDASSGIKRKLLDVYEGHDETAAAIFERVTSLIVISLFIMLLAMLSK